MNVFNDLNNLPKFKNSVITIGSFDGVHCGHQKILQKVNSLARKVNGESIAITFHPHPREVIFPKDKSLRLLNTINEKVELLKNYGIDNVVVVPFTIEFSQQKADEYIQKFLVEKFHPKYIVIGYDHRFGLNRQGDINFLKWHSKNHNYQVIEIEKQEIDDIAVSSTKIRKAIEQGRISEASRLLGHSYLITGRVIKGQQIGAKIGFPTANLEIQKANKLIPKDGIYAVYAYYKNERYSGMLYIGKRPTLKNFFNKTIEVNIFDFNKDLYGDSLKIELLEKIREDNKFDSLESLKAALIKDKASTKTIIKKLEDAQNKIIRKSNPSVAVVILNWNGKDFLEQYLPPLLKTNYDNFEIIVADNGSTDESLITLKHKFPTIKIIDLESNHGFAKGYNLANQQIDSDYLVLLNSDVEVTDNWIDPIIKMMEKDKSIAAAQPKVLAQARKTHFEYAGASGGWLDVLGYPFCRGRILGTVEADNGQYNSIQEVFWATGAALFIRPHLFNSLDGFDESFFAHMEEIDLCWRLKRAGYKIMANPESVVYHVGGGTLDYQSPKKTFLNFRNSLFMLLKNEPKRKLFWLIPLRLILDGLAGALFLMEGKFKHISAIIKAHFAFYQSYSKIIQQKKLEDELINKISISDSPNLTGVFSKSIVVAYYLKGKKYFHKLGLPI